MSSRERAARWLHSYAWPVVGGLGLLIAVAVIAHDYLASRPYDPLGAYPVQTVNSRVRGVNGPAIVLGNPVSVTGTKCLRSGQQHRLPDGTLGVAVRGTRQWNITTPATETSVSEPTSVGVRRSGCVTATYVNELPGVVYSAILRELADGNRVTLQVTGSETPLQLNGRDGVARSWQTENIRVVIRGEQYTLRSDPPTKKGR